MLASDPVIRISPRIEQWSSLAGQDAFLSQVRAAYAPAADDVHRARLHLNRALAASLHSDAREIDACVRRHASKLGELVRMQDAQRALYLRFRENPIETASRAERRPASDARGRSEHSVGLRGAPAAQHVRSYHDLVLRQSAAARAARDSQGF